MKIKLYNKTTENKVLKTNLKYFKIFNIEWLYNLIWFSFKTEDKQNYKSRHLMLYIIIRVIIMRSLIYSFFKFIVNFYMSNVLMI